MTERRMCPICKRSLGAGEEAERVRPFCSKRCADIDLGRWLTGSYAIPVVESEDEPQSESGEGEESAAGLLRH